MLIELLPPTYVVLYAFAVVGGIRLAIEEGRPAAIIGLDTLASALALIGFALYHLGIRSALVVAAWKIVAPTVTVVILWLMIEELRSVEPDPEFSDQENVWLSTIGAWLSILLIMPAIWYSFALGYGS
ncbi:MAG: hypothetical protein AAF560_20660 [Acidobacteriota bacterium]